MILSFSDWNQINEARDKEALLQDFREKNPETAEVVKGLDFLLHTGLIDDSGYNDELSAITSAFKKWIKGHSLNPREKEDLEILKEIGNETGMVALRALSSKSAQALFDQGLHLVSSPNQLVNGTLVFSADPQYRRKNGWGIGFFPKGRKIRRMTPKGIYLGVFGRSEGSMDVEIKKFKNLGSELEFFDVAMQWAADNIDFEQVKNFPEPAVWKYYKKKKKAVSMSALENKDTRAQAAYIEAMGMLKDDEVLADEERYRQALQMAIDALEIRKEIAQENGNIDVVAPLEGQIQFLKARMANS